MRNSLMTRGCAALATILCVTACASVAVAQTQYNWQGGSGTSTTVYWAASNSSITPWATSSVGSFYPTTALVHPKSGVGERRHGRRHIRLSDHQRLRCSEHGVD